MITKENEITSLLKEQLKPKYYKILIRKYPSNSSRIKNMLIQSHGILPSLRPEIDMIFFEKGGMFNAVEIKFFKKNEMNEKVAFYKGIDQALALYKYEFDNVGLWHFFSSNITVEEINKFGAETWYFIRNSLKLSLNFSYFKIEEENEDIKFSVLQYINRRSGFNLGCKIDDNNLKSHLDMGIL